MKTEFRSRFYVRILIKKGYTIFFRNIFQQKLKAMFFFFAARVAAAMSEEIDRHVLRKCPREPS